MKKYFACLLTFFIITFCAFSCLCQDIDKTEQLPTYSLTIGDKIISLQETKDGFLKDTEIDVLWEVVRQTPTHIIAFQPDGKLVKLEKTKPQLKSVNLNPDERMDIEYSSKEYTPESPYIVLNPYGFTPLTALMRFKTEKPSHVRITIKGRGRAPDLSFNHPENKTEHYLPILGLYANHTNKIDLTVYTETEKKTYPLTIKTEPFSFPLFYMPMQKKDNKNYFYDTIKGLIIDEYGFVRYYNGYTYNSDYPMIYIYQNELIAEDGVFGLHRLNLFGKELQSYPYPKDFVSFKHGITRMPNGNFLVIGTQKGNLAFVYEKQQPTDSDIIIEIDYKTGKEVKRFDLGNILNPNREIIVNRNDYKWVDWIHLNSVQYDVSDNSIVISGRHVGMVKIDYETGALKWVFGPALGYEKSGRQGTGPALWDKVLTAVDKDGNVLPKEIQTGMVQSDIFQWPTTTHDAKVLGNGYFSILNNNFKASDKRVVSEFNSRGMIFKIDEEKKTIQQVWSEKTGLFSEVGSGINIFPNFKNVVVFLSEVKEPNKNLNYGYLVRYDYETKEKLFEAVIHRYDSWWFYRMEPIDLRKLKLTD